VGIAYSTGRESGQPVIDASRCNRCQECVRVCPAGCLSPRADGIRIEPDAKFGCLACGHCVMVCPHEAITVRGRGIERSAFEPLPPAGALPGPEALRALLLTRRSVRHFIDRPVPGDVLDAVIAAAETAPMGLPPWEVGVVVFPDRAAVGELARDTAGAYRRLVPMLDNPVSRVLMRLFMRRPAYDLFYTGILPLGRDIVAAARNGEDHALWNAPAALLFHASPYADAADAAIACTYAMLQAHALGLGTTMIGSVPGPLAHRRDLLDKYGVPRGHQPRLALILGYPAVPFRRTVRRALFRVTRYAAGT